VTRRKAYLTGTVFVLEIKRCEEVLLSIIHPRPCGEAAFNLFLQSLNNLIASRQCPILLW
jgi:hypothetical protein